MYWPVNSVSKNIAIDVGGLNSLPGLVKMDTLTAQMAKWYGASVS